MGSIQPTLLYFLLYQVIKILQWHVAYPLFDNCISLFSKLDSSHQSDCLCGKVIIKQQHTQVSRWLVIDWSGFMGDTQDGLAGLATIIGDWYTEKM